MKAFENLFHDEMDYLKQQGKIAADENPALAVLLGEASADPDVERLKEAFALLSARLRGKIDDAFPEITSPLLERSWPFPLRAIPATTLLQFSATRHKRHITTSLTIPEGAKVSGINKGRAIVFTTAQPLSVEPLEIIDRTLIHSNDSTDIILLFKYYGKATAWRTTKLSLYLGNDEKKASLLRYYLDWHLAKSFVGWENNYTAFNLVLPLSREPTPEGLVLPVSSSVFWPQQLLAEYYYLKHTQDFITLDFGQFLPEITLSSSNTFTIKLRLNAALPLQNIADCFLLNCVPAVNLAAKTSAAVPFMRNKSDYPIPLEQNSGLYRLHALEHGYSETETGARAREASYYPIAKYHNHENRFSPDETQRYYYQSVLTESVTGEQHNALRFYDRHLQPLTALSAQSFICHYTGFDWQIDEACQLDTISADIAPGLKVRNITTFTPVLPAISASDSHWREAIDLLAVSPMLLSHKEQIKQMLKQIGFHARSDAAYRDAINKRIDSIVAVKTRPTDCLRRGVAVRSLEMFLTLEPKSFEHKGEMYQFARILQKVLTVGLSANSFFQLNVINAATDELWTLNWVPGQRTLM